MAYRLPNALRNFEFLLQNSIQRRNLSRTIVSFLHHHLIKFFCVTIILTQLSLRCRSRKMCSCWTEVPPRTRKFTDCSSSGSWILVTRFPKVSKNSLNPVVPRKALQWRIPCLKMPLQRKVHHLRPKAPNPRPRNLQWSKLIFHVFYHYLLLFLIIFLKHSSLVCYLI